ncbi:MAG: tRNA (cytidine(56)-2'-O)-methyltransferase [Candidatus ainarchaeum sp.]|nr:tRNA (cytidine(56)-2'-O)-methyltransferase [Candidatus ainarchaeum sp.]MDD3975855.1 tRNA (cytidine(56)-2'-O)-methyltransferase [Candidatus ainarchaeum sp.]
MIKIIKLDHRPLRDKRITTHCALVSRTFGADEFLYAGVCDKELEKNIINTNERWGDLGFKIKFIKEPLEFVKKYKGNGTIIHLTMYGGKILEYIENIKKNKKEMLIIIGGPKVPGEYYKLADFNISVTNQPHSEVAALAIILNYINPEYLEKDLFKSNIKIIPNKDHKNVINLK